MGDASPRPERGRITGFAWSVNGDTLTAQYVSGFSESSGSAPEARLDRARRMSETPGR